MNLKTYIRAIVIILLALSSVKTNFAQETSENKNGKKSEIQNLVNSRNYVFVAQSAFPMGGRSINLTTPYDVRVSDDTVASDLPYFGRAFAAPLNPAEGGIRFTSIDFNYHVKDGKKGTWDVTISPKDSKDVRQMLLNISESGYGTLQVISTNRQQISYRGYLKEKKGKI